jgi:regulation of enolase protein 1 (concanavalin A-like superfamily)
MNTSLADRTWILPDAIYIGPRFVLEDGTMEFSSVGGKAVIYTATGRQEKQTAPASLLADPALGAWSWRDAAPEAATAFDDSGWLSSTDALPMERYASFQNGYGWYRATFTSSAAGTIKVQFAGSAGDFRVYLNGAPASLDSLKVKSGSNTLAILAMTTARPKMYNFTGATGFSTSRGVWGPVTVIGSPSVTWNGWHFHGGLNGLDETPLIAQVTNWAPFLAGAWQSTTPPAGQPTFWRADFNYATAPGSSEILQLLADGLVRGQVWLNGHNLGPVPDAHPIYLPECWLGAQNTLVVFDAQGASPSQLRLQRLADFVPAAPTGLAANVQSGKINLNWTAPLGIPPDHYEIQRALSLTGPFETIATADASGSTVTDTPPAGSEVFYYQVSAVFGSGEVSQSNVVGARPTSGIRSPWISGDIGAVGVVGDAFLSQNIFSLSGSGSDIWDTADAFRYVFQPASGDCTITARVVTQEDTDQWTKVGVMIRETLAPTSRQASMLTTSRNGIVFSRRTTAASTTNQSDANAMQTPYWVRVTRQGNTFTGYTSADGKTWTVMGSDTIAMSSSIYVGLAVTSHNNAVTCTSTFSNVTLILERPATPANFTATPLSDSGVKLAWSATGQDFVKYALQYSARGTNLWQTAVNTLTANTAEYTLSGLDAATTYDFRLQAYATSGSSTYATASATTSARIVDRPAAEAISTDSPIQAETAIHTSAPAAAAPAATPAAQRTATAPSPRKLAVLILSPTSGQSFPSDRAIPLRGRILTSRAATKIDLRWADKHLVIKRRTGWFAKIPPLEPGLYTLQIRLRDALGRSAVKMRRFQVVH